MRITFRTAFQTRMLDMGCNFPLQFQLIWLNPLKRFSTPNSLDSLIASWGEQLGDGAETGVAFLQWLHPSTGTRQLSSRRSRKRVSSSRLTPSQMADFPCQLGNVGWGGECVRGQAT